MPWKCELVTREQMQEKIDQGEKVPIGWMWFFDEADLFTSSYYQANNKANRPPLYVQLPDGPWLLDGNSTRSGDGWIVTGEPPNLNITPSINSAPGWKDGYHGYLTNGELTDDLEGRTYNR